MARKKRRKPHEIYPSVGRERPASASDTPVSDRETGMGAGVSAEEAARIGDARRRYFFGNSE